jgi:hypothetical protein
MFQQYSGILITLVNVNAKSKPLCGDLNISNIVANADMSIVLVIHFFVEIWSWLADKLHFILSYEAGFYKLTDLKVDPPFCRITAYTTMPG